MASQTAYPAQTSPRRGEGFWLWVAKQITGPFILVIIVIHFLVNHMLAEGALLSYSDVLAYYQNWIVPVMEGIFLILVVGHSLLGVRSIILDMRPSPSTLRVIDILLLVIGVVSVVYGLWLIRAIIAAAG